MTEMDKLGWEGQGYNTQHWTPQQIYGDPVTLGKFLITALSLAFVHRV